MSNNWPKNDVHNYTAVPQRLGNKTLFTTSVDKGTTEVRYFSGTDAEIYFDEIYIDEVVQIQYQIQQNTMPLFGYNSYTYDQVARGSRLINGSFTINFTQANYLYDVLNTLSEQSKATDIMVNTTDEGTPDDQDKYFNSTGQSKLAMNTPNGPMLNKSFDIVLSYGDARQGNVPNSTMLILTKVVLTGCSQVLGINGDPVYETYTFIAKDIASFASVNKKESTQPVAATVATEEAITIDSLTYSEEIDASTNKPYGIIKLLYHSKYPVYEIKMQFKSLGVETAMTTIATQGQYVSALSTTITYRASDSLRANIKKYCNNQLSSYTPNILNVDVDVLFAYENSRTKIVGSKLKLKTVYTDQR